MNLDRYVFLGLLTLGAIYLIAKMVTKHLGRTSFGKRYPIILSISRKATRYLPLSIVFMTVFFGLVESSGTSNNLKAMICSLLGMSLSYEVFQRSLASISVGSLTYALITRSMDFM